METQAFDPTAFICKEHNKKFAAVELDNLFPKLLCTYCMTQSFYQNALDVRDCFTEDAIKEIYSTIMSVSDMQKIQESPRVKALLAKVDDNFNKLISELNQKKAEFKDKVLSFLIELGGAEMNKDQISIITQKLEVLLTEIKKENTLAEDSDKVIEYCQLFKKLDDFKRNQSQKMKEIEGLSKIFLQKLETYLEEIDQNITECLVPNRDIFQYIKSGGQVRSYSLSAYTGFSGSHVNIQSVAISPNKNFLVTSATVPSIKVWNVKSRSLMSKSDNAHSDITISVAISPNSNYIASSSKDGSIKIWEAQTMKPLVAINDAHLGAVNTLKYTPDSTTLLSGGGEGHVKLWNALSGTCIQAFTDLGHKKDVYSLAVQPGGKLFISVGGDNTIRIFDLETIRNIHVIENAHSDSRIYTVDITPNGKYFLTGAHDDTIKVWNLEGFDLAYSIKHHHKDYVSSIRVAPNSQFFVSGGRDCTIKIWDLNSRSAIAEFHHAHNFIGNDLIAISPSSDYIVSSVGEVLKIFSV